MVFPDLNYLVLPGRTRSKALRSSSTRHQITFKPVKQTFPPRQQLAAGSDELESKLCPSRVRKVKRRVSAGTGGASTPVLVGCSPLRGAAGGGFTSHDPAARLAVCCLPPDELTGGGQQQPCAAADSTPPPATLFTGSGHNIRLLVGAGRAAEAAKNRRRHESSTSGEGRPRLPLLPGEGRLS